MLLPKRVIRKRRIRSNGVLELAPVISRYDFTEGDDMVSRAYVTKLGVPIVVSTKVKCVDPLIVEHIASVGDRKMKMKESTYQNALNLMLYNSNFRVLDIRCCINDDGEANYQITKVPLGRKVDDKKRKVLQTNII